jgi:hypothetical protein
MSGASEAAGLPPRPLRLGAALGWTLLILILCFIPADWLGLVIVEEGPARLPLPSPDKLVHFLLFSGFAALWTLVAWPRRAVGRVAVAGLALAVLTELVQDLPAIARDGNLPDALADTLGVLAGATFTPVFLRNREARKSLAASPKKLADS